MPWRLNEQNVFLLLARYSTLIQWVIHIRSANEYLAAMNGLSLPRIACFVMLLSIWVGCGRKDSDTAEKTRIQPGAQPTESADWGFLPLRIVKAYMHQQPLEQAPWHADGGHWTFFDCQLANDPATKVVIGVTIRSEPKGEIPIAWGEAVLAVSDAATGARFVEAFAKAFHQRVPPSQGQRPPGRVKVHTALLGSKLTRDPQGGFSGRNGTWTATKWFLSDEKGEAEVFFNFSTSQNKAEFSEKDEEYREASGVN
jgi:hypothetical protein